MRSITDMMVDLSRRDLLEEIEAVCRRRGVLIEELLGRSRDAGVSAARFEVWHALYHDPERRFSYPVIGRMFDRDHTTVMSGVAAHGRKKAA